MARWKLQGDGNKIKEEIETALQGRSWTEEVQETTRVLKGKSWTIYLTPVKGQMLVVAKGNGSEFEEIAQVLGAEVKEEPKTIIEIAEEIAELPVEGMSYEKAAQLIGIEVEMLKRYGKMISSSAKRRGNPEVIRIANERVQMWE